MAKKFWLLDLSEWDRCKNQDTAMLRSRQSSLRCDALEAGGGVASLEADVVEVRQLDAGVLLVRAPATDGW